MRPRPAAVAQNLGVSAAGFFQGVGEDWEAVEVLLVVGYVGVRDSRVTARGNESGARGGEGSSMWALADAERVRRLEPSSIAKPIDEGASGRRVRSGE
jgi:hypothetical protein